jgi:hypothetical protein
VLTYLAEQASREIEQDIPPGALRRASAHKSWVIIFDGLDEVPSDIKDDIAKEVKSFLRNTVAGADVLTLCTSRPQGYSGQFNGLVQAALIEFIPLTPAHAFACAEPLLRLDRSEIDANNDCEILRTALKTQPVQELMTTPLQKANLHELHNRRQ